MGCVAPLTAYYSREIGKSGKRGITFSRNASFSGEPLQLPCGQCTGCRLERSRQWALRCVKEAKMHARNCVLTLTYNPESSPGASLVKRDLQLFMKRLRKEFGSGIRFYACGEYGETHKRPHYHCILFGLDFDDKKYYKQSKTGDNLYTSATAERIWSKGFCVVGEVTFESCAYVARYVIDKVTGPKADDWYVDQSTGEVLVPEFTNMSRRPGIGSSYFLKYGAEVYVHDSVVERGMEVRPPRYFDVLMDAIDPKRMAVLKRKRRRMALVHKADNTPERRRVKEEVTVRNLNMWKRNVE